MCDGDHVCLPQNITLTEEDKYSLAVKGEFEPILQEHCPDEFRDIQEQDVSVNETTNQQLHVPSNGHSNVFWIVTCCQNVFLFVDDCLGGSIGWYKGVH